jgi:hypothetical protein
MRAALLRLSRARPFFTHACYTASLSGVAGAGSRTSRNSCNPTEVDMSNLSFVAPLRPNVI